MAFFPCSMWTAARITLYSLVLLFVICIPVTGFASPSATLAGNETVVIDDVELWRAIDLKNHAVPVSLTDLSQLFAHANTLNASLTNQSGAYLARLTLTNSEDRASSRFFRINANFVDIGLGFWQSDQTTSLHQVDFSQHHDTDNPKLMHAQVFELTLNPNESGELWLYIKADHYAKPLTLKIISSQHFFQQLFMTNALTIFSIATMLALAIIALALYIKTRLTVTLACSGYIGLHGLGWAAASGLIDDLFNIQVINTTYLGMILFPFAIAAACQFTKLLFNMNYHRKSWAKLFNYVALACIFFGVVTPFVPFSISFAIAHIIAVLWVPLAILTGFKMMIFNDFRAKYYLIGNILYGASLIYYMLSHSPLLPAASQAELVVLVALAADCICILLSLATWLQHKKQDYSRAYSQARIDPLTHAGNRHALNEALAKLPKHYLVCFIDYDGVKTINDKQGHGKGDELLQFGTQLMNEAFRGEGDIFRTGGDEFICLFSLKSANQFTPTIQNIKQMITDCQVRLHEKWPTSGISYGIASSLESANQSQCLALADQRMYQQKRSKKTI
ncbi:diguanylate cyclase [Motilimonas sp. 1_MG-2023]|uniref:GGDEF domain-containing protein n=1 Tax=Motilimonas sp. 1_MG-2023 TaxID=3062672 RepID=UPI0026E12835|nr:GGDEF domain-containing protein [Motilimonas sp. 1_MG-2023]MDO6524653.1 diguanylate cyclase [Motilimonas sp. 1_MG-2023]